MNELPPQFARIIKESGTLVIDLPVQRIRLVLWSISLGIIALGIFQELLVHLDASWAMPMIDLDSENSLPEWWSVTQFLLAATILVVCGIAEVRWKAYWFGLAAIFLFLSVDESIGIHEWTMGPLRAQFHFGGFLTFPWIIPYAATCLLIAFLFIPFVLASSRCSLACCPGWRALYVWRDGDGDHWRLLRLDTQ